MTASFEVPGFKSHRHPANNGIELHKGFADTMSELFLDAKILAYVASKKPDAIELPDQYINDLSGGMNKSENALFALQERGAILIDGYEEEGFKGNWWMVAGPKILECMNEEIDKIADVYGNTVLALETEKGRVNSLVGFDLAKTRNAVDQIDAEIAKVAVALKSSPTLAPMLPTVSDIASHFAAVRAVLNNLEDVYRGLLKPIQDEGKSGIRHTTIWAILGIIASTAVSVGLTLWTQKP